jgi:hypothetical protein
VSSKEFEAKRKIYFVCHDLTCSFVIRLYVERKYIMQQLAEIRQIASSRAKGPKKLE